MKDWTTLEPDKYTLVGSHRFTRGRAHPIDRIVIHHNAANRWSSEQIRDLWNSSREASAHYQVEADGTIGQLVNDWDTAWHAANSDINARSIGIEHANISGPPRWQISDETIEAGAHLTAALCRAYKLGRPEWGKNIFPHSRFTSTSCPHQLDVGGEDHDSFMRRATYWYDHPAGSTTPQTQKESIMADPKLDRIHHELTHRFQTRVTDESGELEPFRDTLVGFILEIDKKIERGGVEKLSGRLDEIMTRLDTIEGKIA